MGFIDSLFGKQKICEDNEVEEEVGKEEVVFPSVSQILTKIWFINFIFNLICL